MKSQLMSTDDYNTFSQLTAVSMIKSHRPESQRWGNTQNDALHLVAEVNAPNNWKRGTILPKIATGRSAKSAKTFWNDYENINIRSSVQQRLENPKEPSIYHRVPKNPKGLYDKPVTDPRPFNILHCRSFSISREEATLRQMYSQMSFLANAVRNTDGTTSYKNLCVNPGSQSMPPTTIVHGHGGEPEERNSLRWPSASLSRPIPRLLLPLRPGSSTQWYAWKVDTPRKRGKKHKRSTKRDAEVSFVQQFGGDTLMESKKETDDLPVLEGTPREIASSKRQTHNSFVSEADPSVTITQDGDVTEDSHTKDEVTNEKPVLASQIADVNATFLTQSGVHLEESSHNTEDTETQKNEETEISENGCKNEKPSLIDENLTADETKILKGGEEETLIPSKDGDEEDPLNKDKVDEDCDETNETTENETSDQTKLTAEEEKGPSVTLNEDGDHTPPNKDHAEENCDGVDKTTVDDSNNNTGPTKSDSLEEFAEKLEIQDPGGSNEDNKEEEGKTNVEDLGRKTTENGDNKVEIVTEIDSDSNVQKDGSVQQVNQADDGSRNLNEDTSGECT